MMDYLRDTKGLLVVVSMVLLLVLAKWEHERDVRARFERCLANHPDWAREFFDPKTPSHQKRAIEDVCLGNPL